MADKNQSRTLKEVFDKGLALHKTIENDVEPSTSENFQVFIFLSGPPWFCLSHCEIYK